MQGTQKGLSTSTIIADSSQIKSGIASGGGSVYLLKGQPLIGSIKDIYSVTDKDGMRFVFGDNIIENSKYKKIKKDFDKMHVESLRKSLPKHALEQIEDATNDEEFKAILKWELTTGDLKNDQQLKRIVTKVYFDFISKFIGKYKKEIMDGLAYELAIRGQYQGSHSDTEAPNEIILNKFTIEAVYLLDPENTRYELDRTDARSPKEIFDELVDELQADRVLYSVHDSPSDIVYDVNDLMYDVNSKNYPLRTPKGPLF